MNYGDKMREARAELEFIKDLSSEMLSLLKDGAGGKELVIDAVLETINSKAWSAIIAMEDAQAKEQCS